MSDPNATVEETKTEGGDKDATDEKGEDAAPTQTMPKGPFLRDVRLELKRGELTIVVGSVGSGKTALISALLGKMIATEDSKVEINATVSYVAQTAWVLSLIHI